MISGTINNVPFKTLLEPDGKYAIGEKSSHCFAVEKKLIDDANACAGDIVQVSLESTTDWIEPVIPKDLQTVLDSSLKAQDLWIKITTRDRWDWIRWIGAVKTPQTREKHILVAIDKLSKGLRRPCCFNRNICSEPSVSHNWVLLEQEI